MKHFYLVSNEHKDPGFVLRDRAFHYLKKQGAFCVLHQEGEKPPADTECVISLGGDGTLLRTVRRFADLNLPFIGINTGTIGYLTEGGAENMERILDFLLSDSYISEKRMMIYGRIFREGKSIGRHRALNDVAVSRAQAMKIARLKVMVNGQYLKEYRCDGLIAATPTGSTAYNFSAGGPIVEPTARLFLLTPVAAHTLNSRTLVLSPSDRLQIEVLPPSSGNEGDNSYQVYFDGEKPVKLQVGDVVEITQASTYVHILKLSEQSFVEILRNKLSD